MALESATRAAQFNTSWPTSSDPRSQGDDHLRLIKTVAKTENSAEEAQWAYTGDSAVYQTATRFRIDGNVADRYVLGRRVRAVGSTTGTVYGNVSSSTYSASTSINVRWDTSGIENEALQLSVSRDTYKTQNVVQDASALASLSTTSGQHFAYVESGKAFYQYNATASASTNGTTSIEPSTGVGRWLQATPYFEEGTFTPTLEFRGATDGHTATLTGRYVRVGSQVTVYAGVQLTALTATATGTATISNFPYAAFSASANASYGYGLVTKSAGMSAVAGTIIAAPDHNQAGVTLRRQLTSSTVALTENNFTESSVLQLMVTYFTHQ